MLESVKDKEENLCSGPRLGIVNADDEIRFGQIIMKSWSTSRDAIMDYPGLITARAVNLGQARERNFGDSLQPSNGLSHQNVIINTRWYTTVCCRLPPSVRREDSLLPPPLDSRKIIGAVCGEPRS
ncbi:putative extracellular calcium-sensing receptor-like [Sesbania bispinosa]|nr:putative extracellular calcium-sensing receptor-like [Sesbania bispinosa]